MTGWMSNAISTNLWLVTFNCLKVGTNEQLDFKNVNDCSNTNIYFFLETSGGQVLIYI